MYKLRYDVRDIPHCVRYGLSARNLWVFWKALALTWLVWAGTVYLGFFAAGDALSGRWEASRLFPVPEGIFLESPVAVGFLVLGALVSVWILLSAFLKVSRITFEQARGDDFYSGRDARAFHREYHRPLFLVPVALVAGVAVLLILLFLLGLVGRIPGAGPVIVALLSLPAWGLSLFGVLALLTLFMAFPLVPAIVACTRGDTFETLFELFSSVTSQPWRILGYLITGLVSRALALAVFLLFVRAGLGLVSLGVGLGMGDEGLAPALQGGLHRVAPQVVSPGSSFFAPLGSPATGAATWNGAPGWIAGLAGVAMALVVVAYGFSSCASFWTLCYLAVRYRKDGEDLLQRADDEEFREYERRYGSADHAGEEDRDGS